MPKETSFVLWFCKWVTKYSLYTIIFLMPIFFLPWTSDVLDFNKQTLLVFLGFIALFAWMLKVLISGKFEFNIGKIHIVAGVLFLIYLLATIFSVNKYGSFWGWPQSSAESMLSLIGLAVFYFLACNVLSRKNILTGVIIFSISALIAEIVGVFQLSGLFTINTIGSTGSLGFFAAIMLPLSIVLMILAKKWWKILFALELIFSATVLFLVNYHIVLWAVVAGCAVVMIFGTMKRDVFDGRWMVLPMFFMAVSLFFIILSLQLPFITQKADEIFLSQKTSLSLSFQAIKERPIFGSGPGTFNYDFLKFKDPNFSQSSLWNVIFNQAGSKILNDLATVGILGLLAFLAFIVLPIFYGIKFFIFQKPEKISNDYWILTLGILGALITCAVSYFLYNFNVVLIFVCFFMIASLIALISENKREYELKPSSLLTLIVTFVFTLVFIFGLGILILDGQRYVAEINYYQGLLSWQAGKTDQGLKSLEIAASMNPSSDLYFSQLSQAYLIKLQQELQNATSAPSDEKKNKVQTLVANSINAGKIATDLNPKSVNNWSLRGYVYQNLFSIMPDAGTWAITSYDEALKLDPNNPYLFAQKGNVFFAAASILAEDKQVEKNQALAQAKEQLEKSLALNPDYSNALYSLGLVYDALGQKNKAIEEFTKVRQLNPEDTIIPKILDNLKAGRAALQQPTPPTEVPPENSSGDNTIKNPPE
ncbi:MAG: tetratricopeptide repeat protein [Candidatus Staskawiczbacteria bacterium]|nr:tetratricopeptide repeat protein [Candidatus Staskawiczbacteria bacterium]